MLRMFGVVDFIGQKLGRVLPVHAGSRAAPVALESLPDITFDLSFLTEPAPPWDSVVRSQRPDASVDILVATMRYRIPSGPRDQWGVERLHATLVELIDERLAAKHYVDRQADPERARAIIGDELFRLAADADAAPELSRPHALERIVSRIEKIVLH